tara:strand:+ start:2478 stop:2714 length:237 start_codon:yes stop_codon:yes gene_type:complete
MKNLSGHEIDDFANDIFKVLKEVPLFYLNEVLELAKEGREREGDIDKLDTESSEEEEEEELNSSCSSTDTSEEEDEED